MSMMNATTMAQIEKCVTLPTLLQNDQKMANFFLANKNYQKKTPNFSPLFYINFQSFPITFGMFLASRINVLSAESFAIRTKCSAMLFLRKQKQQKF